MCLSVILCVCVGLMYDLTGSYAVGFITLSCVALIALSLVVAIYIVDRRMKKMRKSMTVVIQSQPADTKC